MLRTHPTLAIETQGLTRRFGQQLAVDGISMHVPARSIYGFLGRNGAGKTTTIKLLLGLLQADAGCAWVAGIDIAQHRQAAARKIGALLEAHGFYGNLSGRENLDLCRRLLGLPTSEIDRVLDVTDMAAHARKRVADFSLGMRQRLGLARAMLGAPPILMLDEPTNGLDPDGIADMRTLLRALPERAGTTVLVSSHLLGEVEQIATHIGILNQGRLVLEGALAALKAEVGHEVALAVGDPERACALAHAKGFAVSRDADALIARFAASENPCDATAALTRLLCLEGVDIHAVTPRQHSLEALYHRNAHPAQ